jgi:uncharacterized protein YbaR (Trm112 family)
MESRLLEILVCPLCKGTLHLHREQQELVCNTDKLAFPIRDGIPVMLVQEARDLNPPAPPSGDTQADPA